MTSLNLTENSDDIPAPKQIDIVQLEREVCALCGIVFSYCRRRSGSGCELDIGSVIDSNH